MAATTATAEARAWQPLADSAATLAALDRDCYGDRSGDQRQWRRLLLNPATVAVAVGPVRQPIAVAVAESVAAGELRLWRLAVAPEWRRRGWSRWLVAKLGERHGLSLRLRETNTAALAAAVAVGFRVQGLERGSYGDCDGVRLWRPADTEGDQ